LAVKQNGLALLYADESLTKDPELIKMVALQTCCCKSESKITSSECGAKGYKWAKIRTIWKDKGGNKWVKYTLGSRCCTFKKDGCPFFSHYKKVKESEIDDTCMRRD